MPSNTVVRARIDGQIKEEATAVLDAMGLTVSDAFRMLLTRIAKERALLFEPLVPNEETIQAMQEARARRVRTAKSPEDLIAQLNADD
jgi:DNA-damage-inducible protein J